MIEIWFDFIDEFKDEICWLPLIVTLEAFYYYEDDPERSKTLIANYRGTGGTTGGG